MSTGRPLRIGWVGGAITVLALGAGASGCGKRAVASADPAKVCASQETTERIRSLVFEKAANAAGSTNRYAVPKLRPQSEVSVGRPLVESYDAGTHKTNCTGMLTVKLPAGVMTVGSLRVPIRYSAQPLADDSGQTFDLSGADEVVATIAGADLTLWAKTNAPPPEPGLVVEVAGAPGATAATKLARAEPPPTPRAGSADPGEITTLLPGPPPPAATPAPKPAPRPVPKPVPPPVPQAAPRPAPQPAPAPVAPRASVQPKPQPAPPRPVATAPEPRRAAPAARPLPPEPRPPATLPRRPAPPVEVARREPPPPPAPPPEVARRAPRPEPRLAQAPPLPPAPPYREARAPVPPPPPSSDGPLRVFVHVSAASGRGEAEAVRSRLGDLLIRGAPVATPAVRTVARTPRRNEVRCLKAADCAEARRVAAYLARSLPGGVTVVDMSRTYENDPGVRRGSLELWLKPRNAAPPPPYGDEDDSE